MIWLLALVASIERLPSAKRRRDREMNLVAFITIINMFIPARQVLNRGFTVLQGAAPSPSVTATTRREFSILLSAFPDEKLRIHRSFPMTLVEKQKMAMDRRRGYLNMKSSSNSSSSSCLSRTSIRRMKVAELRSELEYRGLPTSGLKDELVRRLLEHLETSNATQRHETTQKHENISTVPGQNKKDRLSHKITFDPKTLYVLRFHGIQNYLSATSCCGMILYDSTNDREIWSGTQYYQSGDSSNEAELISLLLILSNLSKLGLKRLVIQGLAKGTTVNQLQGNYGVNKKRLKPLFEKIDIIMKQQLEECEVWGIATDQVRDVQRLAQKYLELGTCTGFDLFSQELVDNQEEDVVLGSTQQMKIGSSKSSVKERDKVSEENVHAIMKPPSLSSDKQYVLRFDGGSRGNPGVSGAGIVIYDLESGHEVWAAFQYLGETTNNVAEYNALLSGLEMARAMGITRLIAEGDSTLVVKQVTGEYEVKSKHLMDLHQKVKRLSNAFQSFSVQYIPRAENFRADQLANVAMDERISMGLDEVLNPEYGTEIRYETMGRHDVTDSHSNNLHFQSRIKTEAGVSSPQTTTGILFSIPEPLVSDWQLSAFRTFVLRFGGKKKGDSSIGAAAVLLDDLSNEEIWAGSYFKQENINQFIPAYIGLIIGLRKAMAMGVTRLIVESHIEFVVQQMSGKWSVKSKAIQPYYDVAKHLIDNYFEDVDFQVIDSNKNLVIKDMIDEAIILHKTTLPGFQKDLK